jgi:hypothetical protein
MERRFDIAWVILWGVLSSAWCLTAAGDLGATFDEPFYLKASMEGWRNGSNYELMRVGTMPLPLDVEYLPLYLYEQYRGTPFDLDADFYLVLRYARVGNLVFWWLLLSYGYLLARRFGGAWAGRSAVLLLATEPNLLGHACLATTDIAITAMILVFAYHYYQGRGDARRWQRWVLPGILYGLAMATKASALTFVPLMMLAFELPRWKAQGFGQRPVGTSWWRHLWRGTAEFRGQCAKVLFVGTIVVWGYCGCDWKPQPTLVKIGNTMTDEQWKPTVQWLGRNLAIFPNAGEGLVYQIKHNIRGHGVYVLGDWHERAVRYYFPVALSIKVTLLTWALFLAVLVRRPLAYANMLCLLFVVLFAFSSGYRVQIGVRIIFPLLALFLLTIAVGVAQATAAWQPRMRHGLLGLLCLVALYPPLRVWPDGLRYANELWGGPDNVHRYLSDSNSDWGHGGWDLDRWTATHGLPQAKVVYHGTDPLMVDPQRRLLLHLPQYQINTPEDTLAYVQGEVVAVNLMLLYGNPHLAPQLVPVLEFFHQQQPIGRSRSFFIYDFRTPAKDSQ